MTADVDLPTVLRGWHHTSFTVLDMERSLAFYRDVLDPAMNKLWTGEVSVAGTLREIKPALQALVPRELPA